MAEVVRLPEDKLERCREGISRILKSAQPSSNKKRACTLRELQSILGLLSFACSVIIPGRAFLKRLFALTAGIKKPYHFVKITQAAREDLKTWLFFLNEYNGVTLYREEMFISEKVCHFFTDASKSLGCGAVFGSKWFSLAWPSVWWSEQNITFLELVPIVLAIEAWGKEIRNHCLVLHTDNMALKHVINAQSSREDLVMTWVRRLVLQALRHNVLIQAVHVPGTMNILADLLSRLQVSRFLELHPSADGLPAKIQSLPP